MAFLERGFYDASETESEYSDDSQEDPNFDVEETRLPLSNLSIKSKVKRDNAMETDGKQEEGELDEQDQKSYVIIEKIIEGGHLEKLRVEDCKIYLRKHGLRLSGNKETLIQRIKEHIDIVNGGGEKKYPASSFVLNCKGDACTGDVVIFEQNVYEEFNIASRSAKGGPCGTRVVAGRILKESYGAAKQQHTFTIEVLWSKGEKPLPPLHPLLIKGRNLYRLKTMRQKWVDEGERQKILLEKHARGGTARLNREARVQQRETLKLQKQTRATRNEHVKGKQAEEKRERLHCYTTTCESNIPIQSVNLHGKPSATSNAEVVPLDQRLMSMSMNCSFPKSHPTDSQLPNFYSSKSSTQHVNYHCARSPIRGHPLSFFPNSNHVKFPVQQHTFIENQVHPYSQQSHVQNVNAARNPPVQQQKCNYFFQGRCYFGDRCKYLHEVTENK